MIDLYTFTLASGLFKNIFFPYNSCSAIHLIVQTVLFKQKLALMSSIWTA